MTRRLLALGLLLAACTRSPDPRLYTLTPRPGSATYPLALTVEVRRPSIAGYLDRREIVRAVREERLDVADDANWAEPLDAMLGRVLAADLASRLPNSTVFTDLNTLGAVPDARIDLELQRLDRGDQGLVLRALVALRRGDSSAPVHLETFELSDRTETRNTDVLVPAMNGLLAQLADRLARVLADMPAPPAPPPSVPAQNSP